LQADMGQGTWFDVRDLTIWYFHDAPKCTFISLYA
jgi:hypothetical protein